MGGGELRTSNVVKNASLPRLNKQFIEASQRPVTCSTYCVVRFSSMRPCPWTMHVAQGFEALAERPARPRRRPAQEAETAEETETTAKRTRVSGRAL
jgi:hypothetical protein